MLSDKSHSLVRIQDFTFYHLIIHVRNTTFKLQTPDLWVSGLANLCLWNIVKSVPIDRWGAETVHHDSSPGSPPQEVQKATSRHQSWKSLHPQSLSGCLNVCRVTRNVQLKIIHRPKNTNIYRRRHLHLKTIINKLNTQESMKGEKVIPSCGPYSYDNPSQVIFGSLPASEIPGRSRKGQSCDANVTRVDNPSNFIWYCMTLLGYVKKIIPTLASRFARRNVRGRTWRH